MPRRSGGGGGGRAPASRAPVRPAPVAPQRANPSPPTTQQGARGASTSAMPPATAQQQQGRQPGLFGQMASTAAGVAVGSSIGHAIGGMFGGGSQQQPAEVDQQHQDAALQQQQYNQGSTTSEGLRCDVQARDFTRCLEENKSSDYQMSLCGYYLDQLKACQAAASRY